MAEPLTVPSSEQNGVVTLTPSGDLGTHESPALRTALRSAMDRTPRPTRVIVNLLGVPYMSTAGVATLVEALRASREAKVDLVLCGLQPRVKAVFDIARLTTVFRIVPGVSDA